MTRPTINVTPLIDVLLVLLIIFMVVAPMRPTAFKTKIPSVPVNNERIRPNPDTLVAAITPDGSLRLNNESGLGTVDDAKVLIERLQTIFAARAANYGNARPANRSSDDPYSDGIERTVFIKAPRKAGYGDVAKLVDAVKVAGAFPVSLQVDDLQ